MKDSSQLLSHQSTPPALSTVMEKTTEKLKNEGDKPYVTLERELDILNQLSQFNLGRFLLQNQGLNGYWTHYVLTFPRFGRKSAKNDEGKPLSEVEDFILNRAPVILATQERFENFLKENQKSVKEGAILASIPCGMMGELVYLDYTNIKNITLKGVDYDTNTFNDAEKIAKPLNLTLHLVKRDAWQLEIENEFDLISSNGLNIYEPDNKKVIALYQQFYQALQPGGKLVLSFLTYPPDLTTHCEWEMDKINKDDLILQKIIFNDIIATKWRCFRSSAETKQQLSQAGFRNIEFIYDKARIMPTAVAIK